MSLTAIGAGFALPATAVALGVAAGAANIFGGLVLTARAWERRYIRYFVALGAGFMLAVTLADVVPESLRLNGRIGAWLLLGGVLLVHLVEHSFIAHFHYGEETHAETEPAAPFVVAAGASGLGVALTGGRAPKFQPYSVLSGLGIHTFFDGLAIGSGFLVSPFLGWTLFIAIFLHKIPEGFTVASVMLAAGKSARVARWAAVVIGVCSVAGVLVMGWLPLGLPYAFPLAGGVTLYVAATDLLPEVNREPGIAMAAWVFVGAAVFLGLQVAFGVGL